MLSALELKAWINPFQFYLCELGATRQPTGADWVTWPTYPESRMKLLLDENLSRRIVPFLQADYPGSTQVALQGLEQTSDQQIWQWAKANDFVIVTKDSDFHKLSLLWGSPPKVIWLKTGNQSKVTLLKILTVNKRTIEKVLFEDGRAAIEIYF